VFNILCEHPETVAAFLVPRVRSVVALGQAGRAIRFLTPTRALAKFITAPLHAGKYFDREGRPVYASERERLMSAAQAKKTARRQRAAARRSVPLQLAYSLGMAASFLLIVSDALAKAPSVGP
jgi:chlorophyll(ide) b reductase